MSAIEALESRRLLANSAWAYPDASGRLVYGTNALGDRIPDFSMVGYKTGNVPLPNTTGGVSVPVRQTINPGAPGVDMTSTIQNAINAVSSLTLDANGFRGAVLLTAGNYPISGQLTINASGVVLMGQGDSATTGTRLEATGTATRFLVAVDGSGSRSTSGSTYTITDNYVPVGATSFHVSSTASLAVGDKILITRPSTDNWIHDIGMDLLDNPWTAGSKNQNWERVVTAISGTTVTIDVPLTNSLDQQYGGGTFKHYSFSTRINQVGVSDMYLYSDSLGDGDLAHATGSISMDRTENGWIHNITSDGFAVNQVVLSSNAKYCTLDDAIVQNTTVSSQAPPAGVSVNGQLNLVENVVEHGVYHAVALGATVPGPNVIYNLTADGIGSDCGPHQRWSTGGLFDNVAISGNDLQANNRGNSGTGHGWAGANYVFWNCQARNLEISNPPTAQNWAIGCIGTKSGDGVFESLGTFVKPTSLYQKQLWDRTHSTPTIVTPASASPNPRSGSTTNLSVQASGTAPLTYTWSCISKPSGAPDPTYSVNGSTLAANTTATFGAAGTYIFKVEASDLGGLKAVSSVIVTDRPTTFLNGDQQSSNQDDTFLVSRSGSTINVVRNGLNILSQDFSTSPQLAINSAGGNDTISFDFSGGNPIPANGFIVDAGSGALDAIIVTGSSAADAVTLSTGNVSINGNAFLYASAESMTLNLGAGGDSLSVGGGNSAITTSSLNLNVSGGAVSMAANSTLPTFTNLAVSGGATFNLNGQNQAIDGLAGAGSVLNNNSVAATLAANGGNFSGSISNGTGTLSLTKNGAGTLVLSGANSYTGTTIINGGVIESGNSASLATLSGPVWFNGGTFHVTADTVSANVSNKYSTTFSGATSASTATFDIDAGVTLTVGTAGGSANMRTNGGGSHGGTFTKTGAGTLRILSNNGQLDDPFKLNAGTVIVESATGLGGADNSSNHVDMKNGTTLVLRQNSATNFLTPIDPVDPGGAVNVVLDRQSSGIGVTHSVNSINSSGAFTINFSAGANVTSGTAGLSVGAVTMAGNGTFNIGASAQVSVTGVVSGAFGLSKTGAGTLSLFGANSYTGATNVNAGTLRVDGSVATSSGVTVANAATFVAGATQTLASLTVNNGGVAQLAAGGSRVLTVNALSVGNTGKLDLSDNDLIVEYTGSSPRAAVQGWINSARAGGTWLGAGGITSSAARGNSQHNTTLGVMESAEYQSIYGAVPFSGQPIDSTAVLVKYTYYGDADFSGRVTFDDYVKIDAGFSGHLTGWLNGDFNADGTVNFDDYVLIDSAFNSQGSVLQRSQRGRMSA